MLRRSNNFTPKSRIYVILVKPFIIVFFISGPLQTVYFTKKKKIVENFIVTMITLMQLHFSSRGRALMIGGLNGFDIELELHRGLFTTIWISRIEVSFQWSS